MARQRYAITNRLQLALQDITSSRLQFTLLHAGTRRNKTQEAEHSNSFSLQLNLYDTEQHSDISSTDIGRWL